MFLDRDFRTVKIDCQRKRILIRWNMRSAKQTRTNVNGLEPIAPVPPSIRQSVATGSRIL